MKRRRAYLLTAALAVGMLLASASPASALTVRALWHMENPSRLVDSSGNGNNGTATHIMSTTGLVDKGYHFNGYSSRVKVPSSASLNPKRANIRMTVHLKFRRPPSAAVGDYDIIRKGLSYSSGGDYKMEIVPRDHHEKARALCHFKGRSGAVGDIVAGPNLADGRWHTISCTKSTTSIQLTVGRKTYSKPVRVGYIANKQALTMGYKTGGEDWYLGNMDEVSVAI